VFTAGLEQQPLDRSDPRRTWIARTGSECCPPDLNHKESPKIYQIECRKELQKIYDIKCECQIACQKICQKMCHFLGITQRKLFVPKALKNWLKTTKMTPCGALRASSPSSATSIFFCALAVVTHFAPILFYKQTPLRTETFTQRSFYADICAPKNVCTQTPLHTEVFTQRRKYLHTAALMLLRA